MNYKLFCKEFCNAIEIINKSNDKNLKSKQKKLVSSFCELIKTGNLYEKDFYSICHELEVYEHLKLTNKKPVAHNDNSAGPDFKTDLGYVECVSATMGDKDTQKHLLQKLKDYNKADVHNVSECRATIIESRFTTSVKEKLEKFKKYLNDKSIENNIPCIICISATMFAYEMHPKSMEELFEKILYGIDYLQTMKFSNQNGKLEYIDTINHYNIICQKNESVSFETGYFNNEDYNIVSGVILVKRPISEKINKNSFVLYINPTSINPIEEKNLKNISYFTLDENKLDRKDYSYKFND